MLNSIRQAIIASKSKCFQIEANNNNTNNNKLLDKPINYIEAFYLATLGGAKLMNLEDKIGSFDIGKEFDAQLINLNVKNSPVDTFHMDNIDNLFQKFIFLADDRNVENVYVYGKQCI